MSPNPVRSRRDSQGSAFAVAPFTTPHMSGTATPTHPANYMLGVSPAAPVNINFSTGFGGNIFTQRSPQTFRQKNLLPQSLVNSPNAGHQFQF